MAGTDYSLKIIVEAADRASGTLRGIHSALGELGGGLKTLGAVALSGLGALAGAAAGAGTAMAKLAIDAAPLQGIRESFAGLAQQAGTSADQMLAALERSSAGMISQRDLMLAFNRAAQLVGTDFAKNLPEAMQYLGKVAAATGTDLNFLLNSLVVGVGRLSPMILDNLGIQVDLTEAYEAYARNIGKSVDELTKQEQQTALMNVVLEKLRQNTAAMPDVAGTAQASWAALGATWQNLKDEIGIRLVPALQTVLTTIAGLAQQYLPPLIDAFQTYVVPLMERGATAFSAFFSAIQAGQPPIDALRAALAQLLPPELLAAFDQARAAVGQFFEQIQPYLAQVAEWVGKHVEWKDVLIAMAAAITAVIIPALASLVSAVAPVVGAFLLAVAVVAGLRQAWESDFLGIRTFTENALAYIRDLITSVLGWIQSFWAQWGSQITAILQGAVNFWKEIFAAFSAAFQGDWYAFGEHLRKAWDQTWENLKNVVRLAVDWFKSVDWGAIGRGIIEGIANGIRAAVQWLIDAAVGAARAALEAAKGFLGIRSPSAVFAEVGRQMMAGMAEGIREGLRLPVEGIRSGSRELTTAPVSHTQVLTIHHLVVNDANADDLLRRLWAMAY